MDNETDAKVRNAKNRHPRTKRVIERFDFENGTWHRVELYADDEVVEMPPDLRDAYIDIITSISDIMSTGYTNNERN